MRRNCLRGFNTTTAICKLFEKDHCSVIKFFKFINVAKIASKLRIIISADNQNSLSFVITRHSMYIYIYDIAICSFAKNIGY